MTRLLYGTSKKPYYCELEYLESTGTQYIDTGWSPVSNDLRVNFRTKSMSSPYATAICGAENRDVVPRWVFIMYGQSADATKTYPLTGDWNNNANGFTFTPGSVLEIDWTTSSTSTTITDNVSGITYTKTFGSNINYSNNTITLKLFQNGNNQKSSTQINYYKIWDGGNLVRDFIPVLDWNMNPAMYDKVNGVFHYNQGTGTFQYGREIHYVDYLEATGTQYINTGYIPNQNTYVELNAMYTSLDSTYRTPFSVRTSDGATNSFTISGATNSSNVYAFGSQYWAEANGCPDASTNVKYFMSLKSGVANFNGVTGNAGKTITPTTLTAYMFARNANGTAANFFKGRIYDCLIKENGTLVRDYIPAIDENGVGFMFDTVSHTCFLNQGTGAFGVGKIVKNEPTKLYFIKDTKTRLIK